MFKKCQILLIVFISIITSNGVIPFTSENRILRKDNSKTGVCRGIPIFIIFALKCIYM